VTSLEREDPPYDKDAAWPWIRDGHELVISIDRFGVRVRIRCNDLPGRRCKASCETCRGQGHFTNEVYDSDGKPVERVYPDGSLMYLYADQVCVACDGTGTTDKFGEGYCWVAEFCNESGAEDCYNGPSDFKVTEYPIPIVWRASGWDDGVEVEWKADKSVAKPDYVQLPNGLVRPAEYDLLVCKTCGAACPRGCKDNGDPDFDDSHTHYVEAPFDEDEMTAERGYCHKVYVDADELPAARLRELGIRTIRRRDP
jgi:hypothetical protein